MIDLIYYPNCSTSKKAVKYLETNNIEFIHTDIVKNPPSKTTLQTIIKLSGESVNKLFNTSGKLYREFDLKNKKASMNTDEKLTLLSAHGMLIKRPILLTNDKALIGYNLESYDAIFKP